jgi:hypothetical protein
MRKMKKVVFVIVLITCFAHANAQQKSGTSGFAPRIPAGIHAAAYSGVWIPHGNLSHVGSHTYIGFQLGASGMIPRVSISVSCAARLGSMSEWINVKNDDSVYQSNSYSAAYIGLDGSYALARYKAHVLDIEGGLALDVQRVLSLKRTDINTKVTQTIFSPDINVGLGYKCWFNKTYIGVDVKYHFLFYKNDGGTNLSGNAITVGLVLGHILTFD